jgi:hypothetical protein
LVLSPHAFRGARPPPPPLLPGSFAPPTEAQAAALVAAALTAECVAETRALKSSLVSDRAPGGLGRADAAGHRASVWQAQQPRVPPSDAAHRGTAHRGTAAAELAHARRLRLSVSRQASSSGVGASAGNDAPFAAAMAQGGAVAAAAHAETVDLARALAAGDLWARPSGGGVSTGALAGLLPQAGERLRYGNLKNLSGLKGPNARASPRLAPPPMAPSPSWTSAFAAAGPTEPSVPTAAAAAAAVAGGSAAATALRKSPLFHSKLAVNALAAAATAAAAVAAREPPLAATAALPTAPPFRGLWGDAGRTSLAARAARADAMETAAFKASGAAATAAATAALDSALAASRGDGTGGATAEARWLATRAMDPIQRLPKPVAWELTKKERNVSCKQPSFAYTFPTPRVAAL